MLRPVDMSPKLIRILRPVDMSPKLIRILRPVDESQVDKNVKAC